MPAFTLAALQRRVTSLGPSLIEKAPAARRCRTSGSSQSAGMLPSANHPSVGPSGR